MSLIELIPFGSTVPSFFIHATSLFMRLVLLVKEHWLTGTCSKRVSLNKVWLVDGGLSGQLLM